MGELGAGHIRRGIAWEVADDRTGLALKWLRWFDGGRVVMGADAAALGVDLGWDVVLSACLMAGHC